MDLEPRQNDSTSADQLQERKKSLTWEQAVLAGCALFELNINEGELQRMAEKASLPYGKDHSRNTVDLRREWYAFVHAGIIYALLGKAPRRAIFGYISKTKELLARFAGYDNAAADAFIDNTLNGYIELLVKNEQRKTPGLLLGRVVGDSYMDSLSKDQIAFISGMMAITLCNILDTLEQYDFLPDTEGQAATADNPELHAQQTAHA